MITGDDLAAVWPEVSHRLTKLLVSRGATQDVVDDVVQEVAARVLSHGVSFDGPMDLMRWAVPVALNLLVDNARAVQRVTLVAEDYDQPCSDVADLVAHRDRVRRVLGAFPLLSAADRAALATPAETPTDRKEAVRLAVRRHRARRRLLALVDGVAAFTALVAAWLKRVRTPVASATLAVAALPVAFLLGAPAAPAATDETRLPASSEAVQRVSVERPVRRVPAPRPVARRVERPAGSTRPAPARPAATRRAKPPKEIVNVEEQGFQLKVEGHGRRPGDGVVCVRDADPLPDVCVLPQERENIL